MSNPYAPPSPPLPPPIPTVGRGWWLAWILATVILPGAALPVVSLLPDSTWSVLICWTGVAGILITHFVSAIKLGRGRSGCLAVGLLFGGWALMLASTFIGCMMLVNNTNVGR